MRMSAIPSFPLLNLPFVPLKEVISYMDLIDQIWLSMLSNKTNNLVKTKHIFNLEIYSGLLGMIQIVCKNQDESTILAVDIKKLYQNYKQKYGWTRIIGGLSVPMKLENKSIKTFWNDKIKGLQTMLSLLCKILTVGSLSIDLFRDTVETCCQVIEKTQKLGLELNIKINKISMTVRSRVEECIRYSLEKCSDIPEVTVDSFSNKLALSGTESYCKIKNASWMTFNDLNLLTKYKSIKIRKLKLTSEEVNSFLKKWMESSTMENADLTVENVELKVALEGLSVTSQRINLTFHDMVFGSISCFEIQRKDGVQANFRIHGRYFVMKTH